MLRGSRGGLIRGADMLRGDEAAELRADIEREGLAGLLAIRVTKVGVRSFELADVLALIDLTLKVL